MVKPHHVTPPLYSDWQITMVTKIPLVSREEDGNPQWVFETVTKIEQVTLNNNMKKQSDPLEDVLLPLFMKVRVCGMLLSSRAFF